MRISFLYTLFILLVPALVPVLVWAAPAIRTGDLVFHKSHSLQSLAILEATGSPWSHVGIILEQKGKWVVAEASVPVRIVSMESFINRGRNKEYSVYRARDLKSEHVPLLRKAIQAEMGKPYDIYFEWSNEAIYCSELVYKVFQDAAGIELGAVEKFSDLRLEGPFVQMLIQRRLTKTGRQLNLNEPIVTPISQMLDQDLDLIMHKGP